MSAPVVGLRVSVATEGPRLQVGQSVDLALEGRLWERGNITAITLSLNPTNAGRVMLGPVEARELARYLLAMADTVQIERAEVRLG